MPRLSKQARQEAQDRRDGKAELPPPAPTIAQQAPREPQPEAHGGVSGYDSLVWYAARQARRDGLLVEIVRDGQDEADFIGDAQAARVYLSGVLERVEKGESRASINVIETRIGDG